MLVKVIMVKESVTFTMRHIDGVAWDNLVNSIPRKISQSNGSTESLSIEKYFRLLIERLSKLKREDIEDIINPKSSIKITK